MSLKKLSIVPLDDIEENIICHLIKKIGESFGIRVQSVNCACFREFNRFLFITGKKYRSTELLNYSSAYFNLEEGKILFVAKNDLYSPVFAKFFGEAQLNGVSGIISMFLLDEGITDLHLKQRIILSRAEKVAVHEVGHLFGLIHCNDINCVMHLSGKAEDIDVKSSSFCPDCSKVLKNSTHSV